MNNEEMDQAGRDAQAVLRATRTWDPETEPTPEEWAFWFQGLQPGNAIVMARYLLLRMAAEDQCFVADHARVIRELESAIGRVQAENRKLVNQLADSIPCPAHGVHPHIRAGAQMVCLDCPRCAAGLADNRPSAGHSDQDQR